jgi:hypothetical protein
MIGRAITGGLVESVNLVMEPNEVAGNVVIVMVRERSLPNLRTNFGHVRDGASMKRSSGPSLESSAPA